MQYLSNYPPYDNIKPISLVKKWNISEMSKDNNKTSAKFRPRGETVENSKQKCLWKPVIRDNGSQISKNPLLNPQD